MVWVISKWLPVSLVLLGACSDDSVTCTLVGCNDEATFTISGTTEQWQAGAYSLDVAFDDAEYTCTFTLPDDLPASETTQPLDCMPALSAYLARHSDCSGTACTTVPALEVQASHAGTPASLVVTLRRDDSVLLDETSTLSYRTSQPNGPQCAPTCHQTLVEFSLQ